MAALPEDIVREILVRVQDVVALFRCATTCKGWRSLLVADDSLLRRCLPENNPIAGLFTQHRRLGGGIQAPCFLPAPHPVLGTRCRFISPFLPVPAYGSFCTDDMAPLASRHDLLLARLGGQLAVCNTLAGKIDMLPCLDHYWTSDGYMTGYAVLTAADCWSWEDQDSRSPSCYKVLIIAIEKDSMQYSLHLFSSAAGESSRWDVSSGSLGEHHSICTTLKQGNAVVRRGVAHWIFWQTSVFYTIDVSVKTGHVSITELPDIRVLDFYDEPYLSVDAEERLTVISLELDGSLLEIGTWDHDRTLIGNRMIALGPPCRQTKEIEGVVYRCLGEKNGMLLIKDNHERVYVAGNETWLLREVTELSCSRGLSHQNVVPLEMNWPAFFVSRLLDEAATL